METVLSGKTVPREIKGFLLFLAPVLFFVRTQAQEFPDKRVFGITYQVAYPLLVGLSLFQLLYWVARYTTNRNRVIESDGHTIAFLSSAPVIGKAKRHAFATRSDVSVTVKPFDSRIWRHVEIALKIDGKTVDERVVLASSLAQNWPEELEGWKAVHRDL